MPLNAIQAPSGVSGPQGGEGPHLKSANVAWGNREGGEMLMIDGESDTLDDKDNDEVEIVSLELEWWIDY